jgi:hypothetical protein
MKKILIILPALLLSACVEEVDVHHSTRPAQVTEGTWEQGHWESDRNQVEGYRPFSNQTTVVHQWKE